MTIKLCNNNILSYLNINVSPTVLVCGQVNQNTGEKVEVQKGAQETQGIEQSGKELLMKDINDIILLLDDKKKSIFLHNKDYKYICNTLQQDSDTNTIITRIEKFDESKDICNKIKTLYEKITKLDVSGEKKPDISDETKTLYEKITKLDVSGEKKPDISDETKTKLSYIKNFVLKMKELCDNLSTLKNYNNITQNHKSGLQEYKTLIDKVKELQTQVDEKIEELLNPTTNSVLDDINQGQGKNDQNSGLENNKLSKSASKTPSRKSSQSDLKEGGSDKQIGTEATQELQDKSRENLSKSDSKDKAKDGKNGNGQQGPETSSQNLSESDSQIEKHDLHNSSLIGGNGVNNDLFASQTFDLSDTTQHKEQDKQVGLSIIREVQSKLETSQTGHINQGVKSQSPSRKSSENDEIKQIDHNTGEKIEATTKIITQLIKATNKTLKEAFTILKEYKKEVKVEDDQNDSQGKVETSSQNLSKTNAKKDEGKEETKVEKKPEKGKTGDDQSKGKTEKGDQTQLQVDLNQGKVTGETGDDQSKGQTEKVTKLITILIKLQNQNLKEAFTILKEYKKEVKVEDDQNDSQGKVETSSQNLSKTNAKKDEGKEETKVEKKPEKGKTGDDQSKGKTEKGDQTQLQVDLNQGKVTGETGDDQSKGQTEKVTKVETTGTETEGNQPQPTKSWKKWALGITCITGLGLVIGGMRLNSSKKEENSEIQDIFKEIENANNDQNK